jgi:hypothetical protein
MGRSGRALRLGVAVTIVGAASGCYSGVSSGGGDVDDVGDGTADDDGGSSGDSGGDPLGPLCGEGDPAPTPLRRLSMRQYENSLADLLGGVDAPGFAAAQSFLADLPADGEKEAWFSNADLRLSQQHVDAYYQIADAAAEAVASDDASLSAIAGACALSEALDDGCLATFVRELGARAYRRPLEDEEVAALVEVVDAAAPGRDAYRDLLFTLLMAPDFLYLVETRGTPIDGREDLLAVSPYELASRLSYHFWQSMPDDELFAAAADGSLATEEGLTAQVDRMIAGPGRERVRATIGLLWGEWFGLAEFSGFSESASFATFAGDGMLATPEAKTSLRAAMVAEVQALTDHFTWDAPGTFADMLLTRDSFTDDPVLASLYGVPPWDGVGERPQMPADQRSGLLTRAAFLVTGDHKTAPLHRGAYIQRDIMCFATMPPPADLPADALDPPPFDPDATTRERYELKTAAAECQGCHSSFNPLGFAQESYDALGRWRTEERLIDDAGVELGALPVDTAVKVPNLIPGEFVDVEGPVQLMRNVVDAQRVEGCLARHYFQFAYRRPDANVDECVIEELTTTLEDGSIEGMLRLIALQPEFAVRAVGAEEGP